MRSSRSWKSSLRTSVSATQVAVASASIGQISDLKGNSEVVRNKDKFDGKLALPIEQLDNVQTGNGRVEIKFIDDSNVKITEHSKLIIDDFVYSGKPSTSKMALKFASGTVRFTTGQSGKMDKSNINLSTPSATIAVRGTEFECLVNDLVGPVVVAFSLQDPGAAARLLKGYAKDFDKLEVKALAVGGVAAGASVMADRRTPGVQAIDNGIEMEANAALSKRFGDNAHINVTSFNQKVLLTGEAKDADIKGEAGAYVKAMKNARTVLDRKSTRLNSSHT